MMAELSEAPPWEQRRAGAGHWSGLAGAAGRYGVHWSCPGDRASRVAPSDRTHLSSAVAGVLVATAFQGHDRGQQSPDARGTSSLVQLTTQLFEHLVARC